METFRNPRELSEQPKQSRSAGVETSLATGPSTRLQQAQRCIADTLLLAAREFSPAEQRALLDFCIERVAKEARRAW